MITPIKLKVLIKPDGKKNETESGLYTGAYSVEGGFRRGTIEAVGPQVRELKVGDRVGYMVHDGNLITHDGVEYSLMYETEVIGWLENE